MRRLFALVLILTTTGPVLAANARTARTAYTFQIDQQRRVAQNQQWAAHFAAQRQPARYHQNGTPMNYAAQMEQVQYRHQHNMSQFVQRGPRPQMGSAPNSYHRVQRRYR